MKVRIIGEYLDIKEIENVKEIKENENDIMLVTNEEVISFDKEFYEIALVYH